MALCLDKAGLRSVLDIWREEGGKREGRGVTSQ